MTRSGTRAAARMLVVVTALLGTMTWAASARAQSVPRYDHVFMMIEENHGFPDIIGNPAAPTLNALASHYGLATQYYAITHPSGPNYVAMLGGDPFGVNSDDPYWDFNVHAPNLPSQLTESGQSWRGYYQGMPYPGYRAYCWPVRCLGVPDSDTLYIAKHNGIIYFNSVNAHPSELAKMRPLADLETDLRSNRVPNFSYVIPDECHDMHGAPPVCVDSGNPGDVNDNWLVSTADAFIAQAVYRITRAPVWREGNNAIVINFDEGDDNAGCCGTNPGGGRALAIVITNHGEHAISDATPYNHYSLLRTLEGVFGLPCLAGACSHEVQTMAPLFNVPDTDHGAPVPESLLGARFTLDPNPPVGAQPPVKPGAHAPVAGAPAPTTTPGHWQSVPAPNLSTNDNNLASVSASSPTDAMAVGNYYTQQNPNVFRNLAEHWDGTRWTAIAPPNVGEQENTLFSVSSLPDRTAWAVGYYADQTFRIRTLTEYWDGTRWHVVPAVNPRRARDMFFAVKALSPRDVWAVGGADDTANGRFHTLIEHWDGSHWSVVSSPDPGPNGNELYGVAGGRGAVWTVGQQLGTGFPSRALIEHFDGSHWTIVPAPSAADQSYDPFAATVRDGELIAAGDRENDVMPQRTLSFTPGGVLPSDNVGSGENDFYAVASGAGETWAAGRITAPVTDVQTTLIETLRNGRWTVVPSPTPGATGGLGGIAIDPSGQAWAVGVYKSNDSANRNLILRWVP